MTAMRAMTRRGTTTFRDVCYNVTATNISLGEQPLPKLDIVFAIGLLTSTGLFLSPGHSARQIEPWTTSRIHGTPEPPHPYRVEVAFPKLVFKDAVTLTNAPGTNRLFVVEVAGKLWSFPDDPECQTADLMIDLKEVVPELSQVYGLTFHPRFPEKPYLYVCYILAGGAEDGSVIARFSVKPGDPPRVDADSELILLRWLAGGHNGCSIKFGPDGYLYISTGDGKGPNPPDSLRAGQDVSNLLSSILRIDVERTDGQQNYAIPPDNPFVELPGARGEIWAYGFRNPWKISFDRLTGHLWTGDVGWDTWELVYRVQRGGNYGWSITEGSQPVHPNDKRGPTPILPPAVQHDHAEARSITGGFVYRGSRDKNLQGAYIYGDYSTGKIWALKYDGYQVNSLVEIADTPLQIVAWGETNAGELYVVDYQRTNQIYRLVPNRATDRSDEFPRLLSDTGLFRSVAKHEPAAGVVPYQICVASWADQLDAIRLMAIPGEGQIVNDKNGSWSFPSGTVLAKTIVWRPTGAPQSHGSDGVATRRAIRLETQILHYENDTWRPYSYRWNANQDDASLVPASGENLDLPEFVDVAERDSVGPLRHWRVASRGECKVCHTMKLGAVLGLNPLQANCDMPSGESQLVDWHNKGLLANSPGEAELAKRLYRADDHSVDLETRARSYLHANCYHCHRSGGGGNSIISLDYIRPTAETKMIDQAPTQGTFDLNGAKIVAGGFPYRSVLLYRLAKHGPGRMPHLGSSTLDRDGLRLIHDWIRSMPAESKGQQVSSVDQPVDEIGRAHV